MVHEHVYQLYQMWFTIRYFRYNFVLIDEILVLNLSNQLLVAEIMMHVYVLTQ